MATIEQFQGRLRRAVREALQKVLVEGDLPEAEQGEARFTTIETLAPFWRNRPHRLTGCRCHKSAAA